MKVSYTAFDTAANRYKTGDAANHTLRLTADGETVDLVGTPEDEGGGTYSIDVDNGLLGLLNTVHGESSTDGVLIIAARFAWSGAGANFPGDSGELSLPSYLSVEQADALVEYVYGLSAWAAASTQDKGKALVSATSRVDTSRRWQGGKVDAAQLLEFPRYDGASYFDIEANGTPAVPLNVKLATLHEADSILGGQRDAIVEAQHNGLSAQATGKASESYVPNTIEGVPVLCMQAHQLVKRFALRSGRLL